MGRNNIGDDIVAIIEERHRKLAEEEKKKIAKTRPTTTKKPTAKKPTQKGSTNKKVVAKSPAKKNRKKPTGKVKNGKKVSKVKNKLILYLLLLSMGFTGAYYMASEEGLVDTNNTKDGYIDVGSSASKSESSDSMEKADTYYDSKSGYMDIGNNSNTSFGNSDTSYTNSEIAEKADTYYDYYAGTKYEFATPEYALELAESAINNVNEMLKDLPPINEGDENFLPEYVDKYLLSGLAMQESSLRIRKADGGKVISSVGAVGICQIKASMALKDVQDWLVQLGIDKEYTSEDLSDPEKAMEVSALYQGLLLHKYYRADKDIYNHIGRAFSPKLQEILMLSAYNSGLGTIRNAVENEKFFENYYNNEYSYANKIIGHSKNLEERFPESCMGD